MNTPNSGPHAHPRPSSPGGDSIILSLVSAGLFLYVGFGLGLVGISGNVLYDGSVTALVWGARVVGIGILVVTALTYLRLPGAAFLDLLISGLAAGGCVVVGVIWLAFQDMQGILLLVFGLFNASAARSAWSRLQAHRRRAEFDFSASGHGPEDHDDARF